MATGGMKSLGRELPVIQKYADSLFALRVLILGRRRVFCRYNTITDGENVTQEALADILGIWDYIKNSGDHPESAKMGLTWVGKLIPFSGTICDIMLSTFLARLHQAM